ncbi:MerR family transcriptional regulator [Hazenella sp. IB182353]|uniref:MerR family transcriptional regulator n=1 Tax=Polycladospora coralii TaxID=2771432 RepID=UPI001747C5CA|nr:MerR family transcriptional regulator [Polycladospora coralii]MBS7531908.1 MerR family transcriptional regulator [Polycladospora coralii]
MYSIGQFSKICKVSVKTLRYYSDIGLLQPAYIDPKTNYRYYDYEEIKVMNQIMLLRKCQVPLATIKQLLQGRAHKGWEQILDEQMKALIRQREDIQRQMLCIQQIQQKIAAEQSPIPKPILSKCKIENHTEIPVYTLRETIALSQMDRLVEKLWHQLYAYRLNPLGSLMSTFHHYEQGKEGVDVELMIPIANPLNESQVLAGGTYASLTIQGPYSELYLGYQSLKEWLGEQNLKPLGAYIEIYEKGLLSLSHNRREIRPELSRHPSEFITKICVAV